MKRKCPRSSCRESPIAGQVVRFGSYFRRSDSRVIVRFLCKRCSRSFSSATTSPCFGQHKRRINFPLYQLLVSGVSMRRAARLLRAHRITVARKLEFLSRQAQAGQAEWLDSLRNQPNLLDHVQFDDLETFEHTKLKPLSITMAVSPRRKILDFEISSMPAKGLLSTKSLKKYGPRRDDRRRGLRRLLVRLQKIVEPRALFESDQNPHYPRVLKEYFPDGTHRTTPGQRGCIVGQGELKKVYWDPLFSFNHTAAMLRANINRLFRRTWCTTKLRHRLGQHLDLYVHYHNTVLTSATL